VDEINARAFTLTDPWISQQVVRSSLHPLDCPICDEAGECKLQEYAYKYSIGYSRFEEDKEHKPKRVELGPNVMLDVERCIMCSRCIRFSNEIAHQPVLTFTNRGTHVVWTHSPGQAGSHHRPVRSGKSTLAFDTLYAEGQRRYVESLSAYARQFIAQMEKPKVDYIGGLSPAIAIEQKNTVKNARSTVGTASEIHDYLRLLYAKIGEVYCPQCRIKATGDTVENVLEQLIDRFQVPMRRPSPRS
jgi:Pyruvate/2-oxoacid:ferredoxin oxidoreductase delta subunit